MKKASRHKIGSTEWFSVARLHNVVIKKASRHKIGSREWFSVARLDNVVIKKALFKAQDRVTRMVFSCSFR